MYLQKVISRKNFNRIHECPVHMLMYRGWSFYIWSLYLGSFPISVPSGWLWCMVSLGAKEGWGGGSCVGLFYCKYSFHQTEQCSLPATSDLKSEAWQHRQVRYVQLTPGTYSTGRIPELSFLVRIQSFWTVLWTRDILVRIRIRVFMPLTNGSGSCYFCHWPSRRQQKIIFFLQSFSACYFLKVHLHHFSKIKSHKEVI